MRLTVVRPPLDNRMIAHDRGFVKGFFFFFFFSGLVNQIEQVYEGQFNRRNSYICSTALLYVKERARTRARARIVIDTRVRVTGICHRSGRPDRVTRNVSQELLVNHLT